MLCQRHFYKEGWKNDNTNAQQGLENSLTDPLNIKLLFTSDRRRTVCAPVHGDTGREGSAADGVKTFRIDFNILI